MSNIPKGAKVGDADESLTLRKVYDRAHEWLKKGNLQASTYADMILSRNKQVQKELRSSGGLVLLFDEANNVVAFVANALHRPSTPDERDLKRDITNYFFQKNLSGNPVGWREATWIDLSEAKPPAGVKVMVSGTMDGPHDWRFKQGYLCDVRSTWVPVGPSWSWTPLKWAHIGVLPQVEDSDKAPTEFPLTGRVWRRRDEWVLELAGSINGTSFVSRHTQTTAISPEDVPGLPEIYASQIKSGHEVSTTTAELNKLAEQLKSPGQVHANMLNGQIASITFDHLAHILGEQATQDWIKSRTS